MYSYAGAASQLRIKEITLRSKIMFVAINFDRSHALSETLTCEADPVKGYFFSASFACIPLRTLRLNAAGWLLTARMRNFRTKKIPHGDMRDFLKK
jgi:hypothetical protein